MGGVRFFLVMNGEMCLNRGDSELEVNGCNAR